MDPPGIRVATYQPQVADKSRGLIQTKVVRGVEYGLHPLDTMGIMDVEFLQDEVPDLFSPVSGDQR